MRSITMMINHHLITFEKEKSVYDKLVSDAKSIALSIADIERKS